MSPDPNCPDCGAPLPPDAPRGLCPNCLMGAAIAPSSSDGSSPTVTLTPPGSPALAPAGALATIAETIGPVPRVMLRDTEPASGPDPMTRPSSPELPPLLDRSSRLQLFGELARGGMGAVLKGRDSDLGRDLAVKVLLEKHRDHPDLIRRFIEEAQIGGQLQHPGIVPIYELGCFADRRPYFAMKLVRGRTLAELLAARPSLLEGRARFLGIFEQVCQTVAYAHARGVIHRDLKPSNVMVGSFGEVQVMDWGLAKVLARGGVADDRPAGLLDEVESVITTARSGADPDSDLSHAGSILGTPAYMAPEQARGEVDAVDERADVFALGSILCEVLTGSPAFTGRNSAEIQRKAARADTADALSRLDASAADAELIALGRACLAADPDARPRDARAVADRLTAHLAGVQERLRVAELDRARAEARAAEERKRRRLQVGLAASILALSTLGGLGAAYQLQRQYDRDIRAGQVLAGIIALLDQARRQPEDPARWEQALDEVRRIEKAWVVDVGATAREGLTALKEECRNGLRHANSFQELRRRLAEIRDLMNSGAIAGASEAFAAAFRDADLDLEELTVPEAAARLRRWPEASVAELAAYLDRWSSVDRGATMPGAVALAADPDAFRTTLRTLLWDRIGERDNLPSLRRLASDPRSSDLPAPTMELLSDRLAEGGALEVAAELLERGVAQHAADIWLKLRLTSLLHRLERPAEALRHFAAVRSLRPDLANLAMQLHRAGRDVEAGRIFADLFRPIPDHSAHLADYGRFLQDLGRAEEATPVFDRAIAARRAEFASAPDSAAAREELVKFLADLGRLDEAIVAYREALRLHPADIALYRRFIAFMNLHGRLDELIATLREEPPPESSFPIHNVLGVALVTRWRYREAIDVYHQAIRRHPDDAPTFVNLGIVLARLAKYDEAIRSYREAIRIDPEFAMAHRLLGLALTYQGEIDEGIASCLQAIRLGPDDSLSFVDLGVAYDQQDALDEAINSFRQAIQRDPESDLAHRNLGILLERSGKFGEAVAAHRQATRLKPDEAPYQRLLARAERLEALAPRYPAVLSGEDEPADALESIDFALLAFYDRRYALSARLFAEGLQSDPSLAEDVEAGHRYNAAVSAARAGCGEGRDAPPPGDEARAALRHQALAWLRADLTQLSKRADQGTEADREEVRTRLAYYGWMIDHKLAGVRDPDALASLPEGERADWQSLWSDVRALLEPPPGEGADLAEAPGQSPVAEATDP